MKPHADIDFMAGSLHWRVAEEGSLTSPMRVGRACRIRLPDGSTDKDAESLGAACQGQLSRIKSGFSFCVKEGQVACTLSLDAVADISDIKERSWHPRNA